MTRHWREDEEKQRRAAHRELSQLVGLFSTWHHEVSPVPFLRRLEIDTEEALSFGSDHRLAGKQAPSIENI